METGTSCAGTEVGTYSEFVNPGSEEETVLPLDPGVGVPSGDSLCAFPTGGPYSLVSVSGYTVPSSEVTLCALHTAERPTQR
ncbi:MAG TPA: hypothetical protein VEJ87_08505 [Acidimicrobiales bacterium]|nr:hypothetical protein [Acidimicrobiales bacterium]